MRYLSPLLFLLILSLVSCKSVPKKNIDNTQNTNSPQQTKVNNVTVAFIKSQLMNVDSQIYSMESSITNAQARLNGILFSGSSADQGIVQSIESEIMIYKMQKTSLEAQKLGADSSQIMNISSQILAIDSSILSAQARLNSLKIASQQGQRSLATNIESEITNYQMKKDNLQAQKKGLEMQLMLNK